MKVVFCSSEVFPYAKTGGLGDVVGTLPIALKKSGMEPIIFLPKYQGVEAVAGSLEQISATLYRGKHEEGIPVYFIRQDDYFNRAGLYGDEAGDYPDNLDRFKFFCQEVLRSLKQIDFCPDIVHCHDWQTALIPVYLKEHLAQDTFYSSIKTVLTIHNLAFQGVFPRSEYDKLGLDPSLRGPDFSFHGKINLLKAGIILSDKVTTVSQQYAQEILHPEYGCGLSHVLAHRKDGVSGIVNGLDYRVWNPETDPLIDQQYGPETFLEGKRVNKLGLQKRVGLPQDEEQPLLGFVGRLSHQKGIDLILDALPDIFSMNVRLVIQGVGEEKYACQLKKAAVHHKNQLSVCLDFDEKTAHETYAGADIFLMPSVFEPCGLSQLISLKYGTIPVGFRTGGLVDTITPYTGSQVQANGFLFDDYSSESFIQAVKAVVDLYRDQRDVFTQLMRNAFAADFSWSQSAKGYQELYQWLLSE